MAPFDPRPDGWASFHGGDARCPGTVERRQDRTRVPCGQKLGSVTEGSVVRVRVLRSDTAPDVASFIHKCRRCEARIEIQVLVALEAVA